MTEIIQSIFGTYSPELYYTEYYSPEGELINSFVSGSGIDFEYIAGVLLFAICLLSLFRIIGAVIKR